MDREQHLKIWELTCDGLTVFYSRDLNEAIRRMVRREYAGHVMFLRQRLMKVTFENTTDYVARSGDATQFGEDPADIIARRQNPFEEN